ncbi:MAG: HNH endonuclease [Methanocorpusculaceae archaeon]|nr:HNH endonuclease [Methanocorpusculaceae archaeon]
MTKTDNLIRASDFAVFVKGMRGDWIAHPDTGRIYSNCIGDFIKPTLRSGYQAIHLDIRQGDSEYKGKISLHRAIWILCRGIPTSLAAEVDHIDRNKDNNRLDNLRLVFRDENRVRKITYEDAEEIRRRYAAGEKQRSLAKAYGISKTSVGEITRRETYQNPPKVMHSGRL